MSTAAAKFAKASPKTAAKHAFQSCSAQFATPSGVTGQYFSLLFGDLLLRLLLGTAAPPSPKEMAGRAEAATSALLTLHGTAAAD